MYFIASWSITMGRTHNQRGSETFSDLVNRGRPAVGNPSWSRDERRSSPATPVRVMFQWAKSTRQPVSMYLYTQPIRLILQLNEWRTYGAREKNTLQWCMLCNICHEHQAVSENECLLCQAFRPGQHSSGMTIHALIRRLAEWYFSLTKRSASEYRS